MRCVLYSRQYPLLVWCRFVHHRWICNGGKYEPDLICEPHHVCQVSVAFLVQSYVSTVLVFAGMYMALYLSTDPHSTLSHRVLPVIKASWLLLCARAATLWFEWLPSVTTTTTKHAEQESSFGRIIRSLLIACLCTECACWHQRTYR